GRSGAHARAPVPARARAGARPPCRGGGVGRRVGWARRRGRLRRRVPLRPAPGRCDAGAGPGSGRLRRDGQQDPGPGAATRAAGHGLMVGRLADYAATGGTEHPPALVVGYATPPDHAYTGALARLVAALADDKRAHGRQGGGVAPVRSPYGGTGPSTRW